MKILISPAKSLDLDSKLPSDLKFSQPEFLSDSQELQDILKEKTPVELSKLMKISENLAQLNWQRNQDWSLPFHSENSRPAVYTFNGEVYSGLDIFSLNSESQVFLQDKLRILSGLYGLLKPLDLIQPYRLEMGTKLDNRKGKNLYDYWKSNLTEALNSQLNANEVVVNLASNEYFKAIDSKKVKVPIVTPIFKDWKNDQLKVISFYAKKARGQMARYLIDQDARCLEDLYNFTTGGYEFSPEHTKKEFEPVFVR